MTGEQLALLDPPVEPTAGRARKSDPQTSVDAGKRSGVLQQRQFIAGLLTTLPYLTADDVWSRDLRDDKPDRGTYSTRLGGLVADGLMVKGGPVRRADRSGRERMVVTYWPTPEGLAWVRRTTSEGRAA